MFSLSLNSKLSSVQGDDLREGDRQGLEEAISTMYRLEWLQVACMDIDKEEVA